MNATRLARGLTAAAALCAAGCSAIYSGYEGQTDYRKADLAQAEKGPVLPLDKKYGPSDDDIRPVVTGETVSVHLTSAFLADFHEAWEGWINPLVRKRGEIAIVARCLELTLGGIDFDPAQIRAGGRVVFYTEDARKGQFLNFSNLPVYGPTVYGGRPLVIELSVIELDEAEGAQAKALLSKLADIGKASSASESPAIALLDTLGGALLSGNADDMEMRYVFVLDPRRQRTSLPLRHAEIEPNHYVLVRRETKESEGSIVNPWSNGEGETATWADLAYNQETGRVVRRVSGAAPTTSGGNAGTTPAADTFADFTELTHLVVRVDTGMDACEAGDPHTLADLQNSLKERATTTGVLANLSPEVLIRDVIEPLKARATAGAQTRENSEVLERIREYRTLTKQERLVPPDDPDAAKKIAKIHADRITTLRELHSLLLRAAESIAKATREAPPRVTADQFAVLLGDLGHNVLESAKPKWDEITTEKFASQVANFAAFRAFFIAN